MSVKKTSCLEENMQWLQQNLPLVFINVNREPCQKDVIEEAFSDLGWNCLVQQVPNKQFHLHSLFNRDREYSFLADEIEAEHNVLVLFGCGDGNFIQQLAFNHPQIRHLILIEPNRDVFISFMRSWKIDGTLSVFPQISLVINEPVDIVGVKIRNIMMKSTLESKVVVLVGLLNYKWNYPKYYQAIQTGLVEALRHNKLNFNTIKAFIELWMVNFWQNLRYGDAEVSEFDNVFKEKPAIVVAAGPSLDKNIHLLQAAKDKALIIAVGSAISILEKKGIKPHFRMAIDPTLENEKLFLETSSDEVPLLYSNHLLYKILPEYNGPKIHMALDSNSALEEYLCGKAKLTVEKIASGFSVANVAVNLLLYWKCDPIVFVGQDLAYTEDRLHASGSWDSGFEEQYIKKTSLRQDIWGNDVYTDNAFDGMRAVFENIIAKNKGTKFLNATEGGVAIAGAPNKPLQELLEGWSLPEYSLEQQIEQTLQSAQRVEVHEDMKNSLKEAVELLEEDINDFFKMAKKTTRYAKNLLDTPKPPKDKEARKIVNLLRNLQAHVIYRTVGPAFEELFRVRREGYLQKQEQMTDVLPKIRLLYLEVNDIVKYLEKVMTMMHHYKEGKECKIIIE